MCGEEGCVGPVGLGDSWNQLSVVESIRIFQGLRQPGDQIFVYLAVILISWHIGAELSDIAACESVLSASAIHCRAARRIIQLSLFLRRCLSIPSLTISIVAMAVSESLTTKAMVLDVLGSVVLLSIDESFFTLMVPGEKQEDAHLSSILIVSRQTIEWVDRICIASSIFFVSVCICVMHTSTVEWIPIWPSRIITTSGIAFVLCGLSSAPYAIDRRTAFLKLLRCSVEGICCSLLLGGIVVALQP